ncbi:MAG: glycosyltransferase family 4 protein [Vicinamibacterales bacterium]
MHLGALLGRDVGHRLIHPQHGIGYLRGEAIDIGLGDTSSGALSEISPGDKRIRIDRRIAPADRGLEFPPSFPIGTMSHILFIASDYKPRIGGIAAFTDGLARGLISSGHDVQVLVVVQPDEKERIAFLQEYEPWAVPFEMVHDKRPEQWIGDKLVGALEIARCVSRRARQGLGKTRIFRNSSAAIARLAQFIEPRKPLSVVFGHLDENLYALALFLKDRDVPYGVLAHDFEVCRQPYLINDRIRRGMMLGGARWIAANSRHTKGLLEMWRLSEEKIMIVHPPVSNELLLAAATSCRNHDGSTYNLSTICRLVKPKGVDIVLRALKHLHDSGISFRYVVAGEGPERNNLERLAEELGVRRSVHFAGYVTEQEKCALLGSTDVFVMPSRVHPRESHEGFGLVFIEAAVFGAPSVGSNAGGIPDAIVDGETGLLVAPESPESLAHALTWFHQHPEERKQMGRRAMERAQSRFSPKAIAEQFEREMERRLPSPPPAH